MFYNVKCKPRSVEEEEVRLEILEFDLKVFRIVLNHLNTFDDVVTMIKKRETTLAVEIKKYFGNELSDYILLINNQDSVTCELRLKILKSTYEILTEMKLAS